MKLSRRHAVLGLATAGTLVNLPRDLVQQSRPATAFGTTVRLTVTAETDAMASAAIDAGYAEIRAIENTCSLFNPASEVSRLNATGHLTRPSSMLREVVQLSHNLWLATKGAFDPAVQPLWLAWQDPTAEPSKIWDAVASNWGNVAWDDAAITLTRKGMALTFNGIAQGYAADRVIAAVTSTGAATALIDTGEFGTTKAANFAILNPRNANEIAAAVSLATGFIATSGDYATTFTPDFVNHHIFDPATGHSPRELASTTVVAPTGAEADGLATAFMVMGSTRSLAHTVQHPHVQTLLISKSGELTASMDLHYQT